MVIYQGQGTKLLQKHFEGTSLVEWHPRVALRWTRTRKRTVEIGIEKINGKRIERIKAGWV